MTAADERDELAASIATYRAVIDDEDARHGDRVMARRELDRVLGLTARQSRRAVGKTKAEEAAEQARQAEAARTIRRGLQRTHAEMIERLRAEAGHAA